MALGPGEEWASLYPLQVVKLPYFNDLDALMECLTCGGRHACGSSISCKSVVLPFSRTRIAELCPQMDLDNIGNRRIT